MHVNLITSQRYNQIKKCAIREHMRLGYICNSYSVIYVPHDIFMRFFAEQCLDGLCVIQHFDTRDIEHLRHIESHHEGNLRFYSVIDGRVCSCNEDGTRDTYDSIKRIQRKQLSAIKEASAAARKVMKKRQAILESARA